MNDASTFRVSAVASHGPWRLVLLVAGWLALGFGLVGVILPVLPTAPFLLLAVACFSRSSPAMVRLIYRLPVAGRYLEDWQEGGISPGMKWFALSALWVATLATVLTVAKTLLLKTLAIVTAVLVSVHFLLMPVRGRRQHAHHRDEPA